jgi:hypothetical protein
MSQVIHKFGPIEPGMILHCKGQPVHVGYVPTDGQIYIWCIRVPGVEEKEDTLVRLYPTGYLDWVGDYIGTVIIPNGLVWHAIRVWQEDDGSPMSPAR